MQSASNNEENHDEGKKSPPVVDKTGSKEDNIATKEDLNHKLEGTRKENTLELPIEDVDAGYFEDIDKDSKIALATITKVLKSLKNQYSTLNFDQYIGSFLPCSMGQTSLGKTNIFKVKPAC